jgi:branched-chain amino acid transport system substrate-binding protein
MIWRSINRFTNPDEDIIIMKTVFCKNSTLLIIIAVIFFGAGCDLRKPIKVGFSGQLTGPHANMGVSGRDGILLALDEINTAGGIAGRKVELLVRDDKGTPEGARAADQELIDAGVVAIIGHMTSSQSMAALPVVEKAGMVLLSPTTSTPALTGRDDHFFRVIADSASEARMLARHVVHGLELDRIAAIYDRDNAAFTNAYLNAFHDELHQAGGQMVNAVEFSSIKKPVFGPIVAELRNADPQGLLIIASAYDGALIAQQPLRLGWQTRLFGSGWSKSAPLIENGGRSVEGMEFVHYHDPNSQASAYLKFKHDYKERFKQTPTFMASNAYEAMRVLAAALEKTRGRAEGLAQALPGIRISGLTETVSLDQHGDGVRIRYRIIVQDGKFVTKGRVGQ